MSLEQQHAEDWMGLRSLYEEAEAMQPSFKPAELARVYRRIGTAARVLETLAMEMEERRA